MPTKKIIKTFKAEGIELKDVMEIILDVNDYVNFIPYCSYSKVLKETSSQKVAKLVISFAGFRIPYLSQIKFKEGEILVSEHEESPERTFDHLENIWKIKKENSNITINFFVNFEIRNKILNLIAGKMLGVISEIIVNSFIKRLIEKKHKIS